MCCNKDRAELDLYFRIAGERFEPAGPLEAREARLRKEEVLRKRSPRAHQALLLARETLRRIAPADALVLLPKTTIACLALLEALDAEPELRLEIREESNPWDLFGPHCVGVASGGGASSGGGGVSSGGCAGGGGSTDGGGQTTFVSGGNGMGGCGGGAAGTPGTPGNAVGYAGGYLHVVGDGVLDVIRSNLLKNQQSYAQQR